jgi:hypothetical protein
MLHPILRVAPEGASPPESGAVPVGCSLTVTRRREW